ncbi:MAG: Omp28-related outer membrane protein [Bacteroidetes bacterium]|nr:Omp28-related outer membrane protein [Bacteroidota bacterium]
MKRHIFLLAAAIFLLHACEEIPPVVTGSMGQGGGGTPVDDQKRQVLIEEFTGVRCVNCPAGSALIEDLLAQNGERLVAVSIHAGEFSPPYSTSQYDFRTAAGDQILSYVGEPFGYPTAVVNRRKFDGQFDLQLGQGDWAGYIAEEKTLLPKVRIDIAPDFDNGTRELTAKVTLFVDETIGDPDVRLSIMITESGIQDAQLTPASSTPDPNYIHKHVLRGMMTNYDGAPISEALNAGAEIEQTYTLTLPDEWKEENCKIVAFISLAGASKDVLQAHEVDVVE